MKLSKKFYNLKGNSILESVIALSIISICLIIVLMICSFLLSPKKSIEKYIVRNNLNEYFYLMNIAPDSILRNIEQNWYIEQNKSSGEWFIRYSDSNTISVENVFYINKSDFK